MFFQIKIKSLFSIFMGCLLTQVTFADENLFGYVTSSDVLPINSKEIYQWITYRSEKKNGSYTAIDARTEFEFGLTDYLTTALYLNFRQHRILGAAPIDEATGEPEYPDRNSGLNFQGMQMAFKYNFMSPYKDGYGFSIYLEPGYSKIFKITGELQDEFSVEMKVIYQKNFLEDQLVWTTNLTPEHEVRRFEGADWEKELALELSTGLSYRFIPKWFGALEARYHSEYPDYGAREHYGIFLGPTIHYGDRLWCFTLTVLPQINGSPTSEGGGNLHLIEHEKMETRIKIGYNL